MFCLGTLSSVYSPPPANTSSALGTLSHTRADACAQKHTHTQAAHTEVTLPHRQANTRNTRHTPRDMRKHARPHPRYTHPETHTHTGDMHKRHTATSRNTSRAHRDTRKWTQQPRDPTATPRNTHLYTETQPGMQCFTQVHSSETHVYTHR